MPHELLFFISLVDGVLAGAVYTPIALAFVVVYKASRMINFALGEWAMVASRLVATGLSTLGLGLAGALGFVFRLSRTGIALRALADDQQAAMAVGIDIHRYFSITWTMVGALSVCAC